MGIELEKNERCENCVYCRDDSCKRYPPQGQWGLTDEHGSFLMSAIDGHTWFENIIYVEKGDWCGEYKSKSKTLNG